MSCCFFIYIRGYGFLGEGEGFKCGLEVVWEVCLVGKYAVIYVKKIDCINFSCPGYMYTIGY